MAPVVGLQDGPGVQGITMSRLVSITLTLPGTGGVAPGSPWFTMKTWTPFVAITPQIGCKPTGILCLITVLSVVETTVTSLLPLLTMYILLLAALPAIATGL